MSEKCLKLCFLEDDEEMKNAVIEEFGREIEIQKEYSVLGIDTLVTVAIPIAALTIQIIDFILNHCAKQKNDKENCDKRKNQTGVTVRERKKNDSKKKDNKRERRELEFDGHRISLIDFSYEEAKDILLTLVKGDN